MTLSALKVLELNEKYNLVEGLCEREATNPEGVELEMRVGEVYKMKGEAFLGVEERTMPETERLIPWLDKKGREIVTLKPGDYYLVKTIEKVNLPSRKILIEKGKVLRYLIADVRPRTNLQRCGIELICSTTNPGYSGELTFGLKNSGNIPFNLEIGARIAKLYLIPVIGEIKRAYSGQHQGGRVTSGGKTEKQN